MTHIAATQQKGSTHLIPGCPDAVGSAGLKSSSLSGKTRDKERPLTDLRRSASGSSPYLGRVFRIQNRWMFGVCLGLAPTGRAVAPWVLESSRGMIRLGSWLRAPTLRA